MRTAGENIFVLKETSVALKSFFFRFGKQFFLSISLSSAVPQSLISFELPIEDVKSMRSAVEIFMSNFLGPFFNYSIASEWTRK